MEFHALHIVILRPALLQTEKPVHCGSHQCGKKELDFKDCSEGFRAERIQIVTAPMQKEPHFSRVLFAEKWGI